MRIIKKNDPQTTLYQLSPVEREAVIKHFGLETSNNYLARIAKDMASKAKSLEGWIHCDCRRDEPAYLYPRLNYGGTLTLVRPNPEKQVQHARSCPFYSEATPEQAGGNRGNSKPIDNYCLLKPESDKQNPAKPGTIKSAASTSTVPALTRRMLHLLELSGVDTIDYHFKNPAAVFSALNKTLSRTPLWPGSNLTLQDITVTHPSKLIELFQRLRHTDFGKQRKQGFVITLVENSNGQDILAAGKTIPVKGAIYRPSRTPQGPFWCMILVGEEKPGSGYFEPLRASLWPAYSANFPIPVDSDPERETLAHLISWRLYWTEKEGKSITIKKPIDLTQTIRPDFIVTVEDKSVVIETMGSHEDSYTERKARTHSEMAKIGPIVEHRVGDDPLEFKKAVTRNALR